MSNQSGEAGARRSPHTRFDTRTAYSRAASRVQKTFTNWNSPTKYLHGAFSGLHFSFKKAMLTLAGQFTGIIEACSPHNFAGATAGAINVQQMSGLRMVATGQDTDASEASSAGGQIPSVLGIQSIAHPAQIGLDRILEEPTALDEQSGNGDVIAPATSLNGNIRITPTPLSVVGQSIAGTGAGAVRPVGGFVKRLFDIVLAGTALVLLAPLLVAVYLLIRVRTGDQVIFAQERVGFDGVPFTCYKFRTMRHGAKQALEDHLAANPAAAREWLQDRKLKSDPRVTQIGLLLRKTSIDELPQLWNVLRGDMSCVGPRPIVADELSRYSEHGDGALVLVRARPGLTGLWQVSGRNSLSYDRRVELDCQYVKTWSIGNDLAIIARTLPALLDTDSTS